MQVGSLPVCDYQRRWPPCVIEHTLSDRGAKDNSVHGMLVGEPCGLGMKGRNGEFDVFPLLHAICHLLDNDEIPLMQMNADGMQTLDAWIPIGRRDLCARFFTMREERCVIRLQRPPSISLQTFVKCGSRISRTLHATAQKEKQRPSNIQPSSGTRGGCGFTCACPAHR